MTTSTTLTATIRYIASTKAAMLLFFTIKVSLSTTKYCFYQDFLHWYCRKKTGSATYFSSSEQASPNHHNTSKKRLTHHHFQPTTTTVHPSSYDLYFHRLPDTFHSHTFNTMIHSWMSCPVDKWLITSTIISWYEWLHDCVRLHTTLFCMHTKLEERQPTKGRQAGICR